jgi:mono/diheme cytochrome c family protein
VSHPLAASTAQRVGFAVVVVMTVGWLVYILTTVRRTRAPGAEVELAPNRRPYLNDDAMEGPRLTRFLWWAFAMLAIAAVGLPIYWLREPSRQAGAGFNRGTKWFDERSVDRGRNYFQASPGNPPAPREPHYGCENCHGVKGIGGVTQYTLTDPAHPDAPARQVQWSCPPLNTVLLRYRPDEVRNIIVYGRANTPMPPWGVAGGGALNDQQVDDLIHYLESIQLDAAKVKAENASLGTDGKTLFEAQCARCHTMGFSYGEPGPSGGGAFGPPLDHGSTLRQFPDPSLQVEWVTKTAEYGKAYGVRGVSHAIMPHFQDILSAEQIQAIVDYERSLQ